MIKEAIIKLRPAYEENEFPMEFQLTKEAAWSVSAVNSPSRKSKI